MCERLSAVGVQRSCVASYSQVAPVACARVDEADVHLTLN